jgi:IclR family transcriptional regulator, acetate operon repressor
MIEPISPHLSGSVRSLERALDLLEALDRIGQPTGVRELGRTVGLASSTVQRLLSVLQRRGYVQNERGRYSLGAGVVSLARSFLAGSSLTRAAMPVLEELALLSGETSSLYVRQEFDRVVVQRVASPHPLRYSIEIGQRLPLHVGAAGLILAAAMPREQLAQLLDRLGEVRLATGEEMSRTDLVARLDRVRQQGLAISREERSLGVISVASPVPSPSRGVVAAVAVLGPPSRMDEEKVEYLAREVRRAGEEIGQRYG